MTSDLKCIQSKGVLVSTDRGAALQVVCDIDGHEFVRYEAISQGHSLFLSSGVEGNDAGVCEDYHTHYEIVLLYHCIHNEGDGVQCLCLVSTNLGHHHQHVRIRKHGTRTSNISQCGQTFSVLSYY